MKGNKFIEFKGVFEFENFIKRLNIYGDEWRIESGLLNERGNKVKNKRYFTKLRSTFDNTGIFRKKVSIAETISWLDSFTHVMRIIKLLKLKHGVDILNDIEIILEYVIEMSKMSRVDVIFKYQKKICLFEFTTVNKFERMKRAYQQKRLELLIYKDLMLNYLTSDIRIFVFPFVGLYEYFNNTRVESHYFNNVKQAEFATEYISKFLISDYCIQI